MGHGVSSVHEMVTKGKGAEGRVGVGGWEHLAWVGCQGWLGAVGWLGAAGSPPSRG